MARRSNLEIRRQERRAGKSREIPKADVYKPGTGWDPLGQGNGSQACTGSLPFLAPTETGPALCLSSSEAEEAVQEEEEAHLRLVVLGMLQLSKYLGMDGAKGLRAGHGAGQAGPREKVTDRPYLRMLSRQLICW